MNMKELAKKYNLTQDDYWKESRSGKWIISHKGCMVIADKEKIEFTKPEYVKNEADAVVMLGYAKIFDEEGNEKEVWTHGEANHKNCFVPYPFAMAEKRLKDRLTLMVISVYGEVYSEIAADEFAAQDKHLKEIE